MCSGGRNAGLRPILLGAWLMMNDDSESYEEAQLRKHLLCKHLYKYIEVPYVFIHMLMQRTKMKCRVPRALALIISFIHGKNGFWPPKLSFYFG